MSSANYIPLTQISPSQYLYSSRFSRPHRLYSSHFFRKRVLLLLPVAVVASLTFIFFLLLDPPNVNIPLGQETYQPNYVAVAVPEALPLAAHPKLRPVRDLPSDCLERYFALGELCHDGRSHAPIDLVWTWVNGSDPLFSEAKDHTAQAFAPDDPDRPVKSISTTRMFRDHDELRHSLRSVLANFRSYTTHFRILTSDIDHPDHFNRPTSDPGTGYRRLGLLPQWLNSSRGEWRDGDISLSLTHHAHFFEPYNHSSFNSLGIEAQLYHLQGISDVFIYMNDDLFLASPISPMSFYTHQYGVVLRIQNSMQVGPDMPTARETGEWKSMGFTNYHLSRRFGARRRPYIQHMPKAIHFPILQELALIWRDVLAETASHAFRERWGGVIDFYIMFAFPHFLIERSREALLWTWTIARIGALDDTWGNLEAERAWIEVGGELDGSRSEEVEWDAGVRNTLNKDRVSQYLKDSRIEGEFRTQYQFSSMDGYAYNQYGKRTSEGDWPGFEEDSDPNASESNARKRRRCKIKRDECFGFNALEGEPTSASDVFKRIAFEKSHCGDCVIVALTKASGRAGLSAFLPLPDRVSPGSAQEESDSVDEIPHLPLVADWYDGQFALRDIMKLARHTNVREWSMRLMQRYRYVIGGTPSRFERLLSLQQVRSTLSSIDLATDVALLCLNDDISRDHDEVNTYFRQWQEKRWPMPGAWESDRQTLEQ